MKIAVFGVYLLNGMAGTLRVRTLIDPLLSVGKVNVLNIQYYHKKKPGLCKPKVTEKEGINYNHIRINGKNIFSILKIFFYSSVILWKYRERGKDMVFYNYGYPDFISFPIILIARLFGYKIIFDIVENNWAFNQNANWIYKLRVRSSLIFSSSIKWLASGCIGISESLISLLKNKTKSKCPIELIPISVDTVKFKINESPKNNDLIHVFWGGAIAFSPNGSATKDGINELISAFDNTCRSNTFLTLTGKGDEKSISILKDSINQSSNKQNISFTGFVPFEEYHRLLSDANIAIMNRVDTKFANDGFPYKLGEYLASGKAVIATNVGDISLYLRNEENCILIPPSDPLALEEALINLYDNYDLISKIGQNGRMVAENYFSASANSHKFYLFLLKILKNNQ